mmetsp:Transcript_5407/g.12850  ORF Transcript_5407/g.12850 Transcript_5407/m.12850 type:complete len:226 (+) Transcript_5407:137-814(+)
MKLRPAQSFLGCSSLLVGVEVTCALTLFWQILSIAVCSSARPLRAFGLVFPPEAQVFIASWAFVGLPLTVLGGVGALHRIEGNLRVFFFYSAATFVLTLTLPIWILSTNSLCDVVVDPALQRQGTAFVCGFADTFVFTWSLILLLTHLYLVYTVWSLAEDIRLIPNPELMMYEDALRAAKTIPYEEEAGPTVSNMVYGLHGDASARGQMPPPMQGGPRSTRTAYP